MLLCKQDELRRLEEQLERLDSQDNQTEEGKVYLASWKRDERRSATSGAPGKHAPAHNVPPLRKELLKDIETKLIEYGTGFKYSDCSYTSGSTHSHLGQVMTQSQQLAQMRKPTNRDYKSVMNYMTNEAIVASADSQFIHMKEDLITLRGSGDAWLDEKIGNALGRNYFAPIRVSIFLDSIHTLLTSNPG